MALHGVLHDGLWEGLCDKGRSLLLLAEQYESRAHCTDSATLPPYCNSAGQQHWGLACSFSTAHRHICKLAFLIKNDTSLLQMSTAQQCSSRQHKQNWLTIELENWTGFILLRWVKRLNLENGISFRCTQGAIHFAFYLPEQILIQQESVADLRGGLSWHYLYTE